MYKMLKSVVQSVDSKVQTSIYGIKTVGFNKMVVEMAFNTGGTFLLVMIPY